MLSTWNILLIIALVVLLFGRGKISEIMGDFGKGIKSFKKGMADEDKPEALRQIEGPGSETAANADSKTSDGTRNP